MSFKRLAITFSVAVFLIYAGLILSLFYFYQGPLFVNTLLSERTLYSLRLSLTTATVAAVVFMITSLLLAFTSTRRATSVIKEGPAQAAPAEVPKAPVLPQTPVPEPKK